MGNHEFDAPLKDRRHVFLFAARRIIDAKMRMTATTRGQVGLVILAECFRHAANIATAVAFHFHVGGLA